MAAKDRIEVLRRWTRITCRTVHLSAMAVLVGGILFGAERSMLELSIVGVVLSGLGMMAMDMLGNQPYLREVRGVSVLVKVSMLAIGWWLPAIRTVMLFAVIVLSSYVSHMPAKQRYFVVFGKKSDAA